MRERVVAREVHVVPSEGVEPGCGAAAEHDISLLVLEDDHDDVIESRYRRRRGRARRERRRGEGDER
jgi:hypothetical protein